MGLEVHRGKGITLLHNSNMEKLKDTYDDGESCGKKADLLVA